MHHPLRSIALITSNAGSLLNFRAPLIRAFVGLGVRVHALAPDFEDETRARLRQLGATPVDISMDRTGTHLVHDVRSFLSLWTTLKRLKPDATFAYFIKPVIYGSIAARLAGISRRFGLMAGLGYVFTPSGNGDGLKRSLLKRLVSLLYKMGFVACDRVFFHNDDDLAYVVDAGLVEPGKCTVLAGTGVDLNHYSVAPLIAFPPRFLLIGRMLREKGVREFAEAARLVRAQVPDAEFHLVGPLDTNPGALTREEIDTWVDEGRVIWHGPAEDVRPYIARCSVYVLPSYREGKPRSTQEAMAMGRAVITTDAPGCRDTVDEGVNGFKVPVGDPSALAKAMLHFVRAPALAESMGRASRKMAEERFDVHAVNRAILAAIGVRADASLADKEARG